MRIPISADAQHERASRDSDRKSKGRVEGSPYDSFEVWDWYESEAPAQSTAGEHTLRLLARWLVSAARKGAPVAGSGRSAEGQIVLDVGPDAEVVSNPEAPEMHVQQAFQRGGWR